MVEVNKEKLKALEQAVAQIDKQFGKGALVRLGDKPHAVIQSISTGSIGVDGNVFSWMPGKTSHAYEVTLKGPKGEGHLAVTSHTGLSGLKLDSAILTGPDGHRYDLIKHQQLPDDGITRPDTSI